MTTERLLTTDEVARRLGVKKATVYAYVSRGLLSSRRHADGKESVFAADEVESFAGGRRRRDEGPASVDRPTQLITLSARSWPGCGP